MTPYRAIQDKAGWADRSARVRLAIAGPDRGKFLHNLVTNDVKRLPTGRGVEAFVTSPQGKTMAYVTLVAGESAILLRTDPAALEALLPHLRKYGVFDEVEIEDLTASTYECHLAGPEAESILAALEIAAPPAGDLNLTEGGFRGEPIRVIREAPAGRPGFTLIGRAEQWPTLRDALNKADIPEVDPATFEALRIEAGTPVHGLDVTIANLPQEVGRDARTINFVKGCYLGQETVARLDALGHVNRILIGARVEGGAVPPPGTPLSFEGKPVGSVTSAAESPGSEAPVLLGYVKVGQAAPGIRLDLGTGGVAVVVGLPMTPGPD